MAYHSSVWWNFCCFHGCSIPAVHHSTAAGLQPQQCRGGFRLCLEPLGGRQSAGHVTSLEPARSLGDATEARGNHWWISGEMMVRFPLSLYIYMYTYHMIQDDFSEPHYPITFRIYSLYYQCWIQVSEIWSFTQTELHEATTLIGMELRLEWKAIFVRYEEQAETS